MGFRWQIREKILAIFKQNLLLLYFIIFITLKHRNTNHSYLYAQQQIFF
jgi:hypothetical protein